MRFYNRIVNELIYGGLSKEDFQRVKESIDEKTGKLSVQCQLLLDYTGSQAGLSMARRNMPLPESCLLTLPCSV